MGYTSDLSPIRQVQLIFCENFSGKIIQVFIKIQIALPTEISEVSCQLKLA